MTKTSLADKDLWAKRIKEQQASGLSIKKWCQNNKLWPHAFYYWKKALEPITFQEISDTSRCRVEITYQQVRIYLESSSLKQCLSVLKELKC